MIHHERLKPPPQDYTPGEWNLIEKNFHPEFIAQTEALFALGNGYFGMRGAPEEGGPCVQNGTFVNGFMKRGRLSTAKKPMVSPGRARPC